MSKEIELVDIATALPQVRIEMKYATDDNLTGRQIYAQNRCLLHPLAAEALARSAQIATQAGYQLLIYDAWRPQEAQKRLWAACPDNRFVADLSLGSHHSRGVAVDVTLLNEQGDALDMGSEFDAMHAGSFAFAPTHSVTIQRHRLQLYAIMAAGGFVGIASEWWHFELPEAMTFPLLTDRFGCV